MGFLQEPKFFQCDKGLSQFARGFREYPSDRGIKCLPSIELLSVLASVIKLFGLARAVKNYARIDHYRRIFYRSNLFGVSQPKHFHSVHIF
jgi:hypothetical protein